MTAAPESAHAPHLQLIAATTSHPADLTAPDGLEQVELVMRDLAETGGLAEQMSAEHLATGGKRLRARLALAAAAALGGPHHEAVIWAAAVELLHNATLVHDDIQDGDATRRGEPTLWSRYGMAQAMNAGDLMLMLPYLAVSRLPGGLSGELSRAIAEHAIATVCGQIEEIDLCRRGDFTWSSYRLAVAGKTGALLGLPVFGAALLAGRSLGQARRLGEVFAELGTLFQLQDDVLDLYGDKGRDCVGSDVYEGKVSALVVAHLELRPEDRRWLENILRTPRETTLPSDVAAVVAAFVASGALEQTLDRIDAIATDTHANAALEAVPTLRAVALEIVALALAPISHCRTKTEFRHE